MNRSSVLEEIRRASIIARSKALIKESQFGYQQVKVASGAAAGASGAGGSGRALAGGYVAAGYVMDGYFID